MKIERESEDERDEKKRDGGAERDSEDHNVVNLVSSRVVSLLLYSTYLRVHIIFVISYFKRLYWYFYS